MRLGCNAISGSNYPTLEEYEDTIKTYAALGVKVMVTEMDISVLPMPVQNLGADI